MPDLAGLVGLAMMAAGAVLILLAVLVLVPRVLGVRRRALLLRLAAGEVRAESQASLIRLRAERAETAVLLVPWRRLLRWARHPLVGATIDWYRRKRRSRSHG